MSDMLVEENTSIREQFHMKINMLSPERAYELSSGEVKTSETLNYKEYHPASDGLFSERIFGPMKDWECRCGKYKKKYFAGVICDRCGVEVTTSNVRRERFGHIELDCNVVLPQYFYGEPSILATVLDLPQKYVEQIVLMDLPVDAEEYWLYENKMKALTNPEDSAYSFYRGTEAIVSPAFNKPIAQTDCVNCGQCRVVCPTGAISIKTNIDVVWDALADKDTIVIAQIAPAVRVAAGEEFGIPKGENVMGKLVGVLHRLGFDEVYDTAYGADLTVMEESKEFMERFNAGENLPLFTSCCPAWVKFCENRYPEFVPHLSSCRSPQQMFGAVVREYYKNPENNAGKKLVSVSIMPCTAKKYEASREEFVRNSRPDVDYVLTSEEVIGMFKEIGIRFDRLEPEAYDMPFSIYSGAGVIFGATGGVTEAAVRRVVADKSPKALKDIEFIGTRGMAGTKICELDLGERTVRIGIVSGLGNAEELIKKIESGEEHFDFVEVMACPGGCVAGAGQPFARSTEKRLRAEGLYKNDKALQIKRSENNPIVKNLYDDLLKNREHELLHVHYPGHKADA